jgi:aminotransferase
LEKGRTFYTSNSGLVQLRQEIKDYLSRKIKMDYKVHNEILVTVGGSEAIDLALRTLINPGDEVIIPQPCFVAYEPCAILAGGVPVTISLKAENEFKLTKDELLAAITPKSKVLIFAFPSNPTGAIMEKAEMEALAEVIVENDLIVLSDEIYAELTYDKEHTSIASLKGMRERTIVINGFSKSYAMTGWRLGFCAGPETIIQGMTKIHQFAIMSAPTTSQYAAIEALKNGDSDIKEMKTSYNQRRRFLIHRFKEMGLDCFEPLGAFYVFPSIQKLGMTSDEFATELLKEEKVAVVPGTAFGECGEGFVRCSYAYSLEQLKIAMDRIERFVRKRL